MLRFKYWIVLKFVYGGMNQYPIFITCAKVDNYLYRIEDLEEYLKTGKGVGDEKIEGDYSAYEVDHSDWIGKFKMFLNSGF